MWGGRPSTPEAHARRGRWARANSSINRPPAGRHTPTNGQHGWSPAPLSPATRASGHRGGRGRGGRRCALADGHCGASRPDPLLTRPPPLDSRASIGGRDAASRWCGTFSSRDCRTGRPGWARGGGGRVGGRRPRPRARRWNIFWQPRGREAPFALPDSFALLVLREDPRPPAGDRAGCGRAVAPPPPPPRAPTPRPDRYLCWPSRRPRASVLPRRWRAAVDAYIGSRGAPRPRVNRAAPPPASVHCAKRVVVPRRAAPPLAASACVGCTTVGGASPPACALSTPPTPAPAGAPRRVAAVSADRLRLLLLATQPPSSAAAAALAARRGNPASPPPPSLAPSASPTRTRPAG